MQINKLSEEWETFSSEIEASLAGGHEALNEASDQLDGISGSFLQRRTWISAQLSKMTKSISEKDLLVEELNCCLEEANNRTNDLERMLMSLRGATLAITEEHQQIYTEKEKEIILLTSELSDKMLTIAELENKIKYGENELRKASTCGTVAFVIVSRLSEINSDYLDALEHKDIQLTELKGSHMQKDVLLLNQAVKVEEAEKYITSLCVELEVAKEASGILTEQLYKEKKCVTDLEQKLEETEGINFLETREKLSELKHGISTVKSCLTIAEVDGPQKDNAAADTVCSPSDNKSEERTGTGEDQINKPETYAVPVTETDTLNCPSKVSKNLENISSDQYSLAAGGTVTDAAVALLRAEIESALEILKRVPIEMAKLRKENKELCDSKKRTQQVMEMVMSQVHSLQASVSNFEDQVGPKMSSLDHKLLRIENTVKDTVASWFQKNESFEHEVTDSKILAVQKTAEVSCILAKFEEAQDTIREADYMVNELMMANKSKKAKIERLKKEKIVLTNEVQRLESSNKQKDLCVAKLEEQSKSDFIAIKGLVQELEGIVSQAQFTCNENFESLHSDFVCLKSQVCDSTKLVHSWIEEIWSEIILKDCALSVLHLCHMGILLETVTGLNAENGLLHHGLCESNSLIYNLRQHNCKSKRELEMCRVLEGKLLADIKNSFDRISREEDETAMLSFKLTSFEEKILDLQQQEEIMLQRSNYMGSELTMLMTELDRSNRNVMASLLDRENLLKDKVDILEHQEEEFFVDLSAKDFHLLVLASELKQQAAQKAKLEGEQIHYAAGLDRLKRDMALLLLDSELKELILLDNEVELTHLGNKIELARMEQTNILSEINDRQFQISKLEEVNKAFEKEIKSMKEVSCSNDSLKGELVEVTAEKIRLSSQFQHLQSVYEKSLEDLSIKETALENSSSRIFMLEQQNQVFQRDISSLETSLCSLQNDLNAETELVSSLKEERELWKTEATKSKTEFISVFQDLEEKKSEIESFLRGTEVADTEKYRLQTDLDKAKMELDQFQLHESALRDLLSSKTSELQIQSAEVDSLQEEIVFLKNELLSHEQSNCKAFRMLNSRFEKYVNSIDSVHVKFTRVFNKLNEEGSLMEKKFAQIQKYVEGASEFLEEFEPVEILTKDLLSESCHLKAELERKDNILEGLLFDLKLIQESASSNKDQKDDFENLLASFEELEDEHDEVVEKVQTLEAELQEKINTISTLELEVARLHEDVKSLSSSNLDLTTSIANALQGKEFTEKELLQTKEINHNLELELLDMRTALEQMNEFTESLKINLQSLSSEKDAMHTELLTLKDDFQMAQTRADENGAIAIEAQQEAESRKLSLDEKEEEVRLLERSVEELERTVNVLESKVDIVKGETELQRMQREDLEMELQAIKQKMQTVESGNDEMKRGLDDKEKRLREALQRVQILEREIAAKDTEISKCKAHISELNLHADAQACEYKQKFKALEVMAAQVKVEGSASESANSGPQSTTSSANKLEKNGSRPRGSGSPFKCIGLGFVQQMKSERDDDELTASRLRIEELEALAARRQKEIFMLNARLATAESMTHDVLRDLLGVKSNMSDYAFLLDSQQVQKITEKAQLYNAEVQDQEVLNLRKQLTEFVEERKGWLEEIDRKQAELVAAQISLEELRHRERFLATENDMFKMENVNHKKKVMELELEVKKLSGQQNIQQRIHHHAKIKEENNLLKAHNEELCSKLRRSESILSRVKEELSHFRAANGRNPCLHIDEEQRLNDKLKESEEERLQLAQKLLGLCTSILKAAGIARPASDTSLPAAEEALEQLKDRMNILNRELQELKLKSRITNERNRLSEIVPQLQRSPLRSEGSRQSTPNRASQTPFLSSLDR